MSDDDFLLGPTPGCAACADEEQRGHDGMCSECRTRRWRASAELWSRRAALQTFGEVLGWCAAMQLAWDEQYTCDECGHVGDNKDDQLSPLNGKRVCCGCWDAYWIRFEARDSFARGVAAALEAEEEAYAGNWRRMPCEFCETTDGEMPVHVAETGGKMHAKCARKSRLYREHAALVDGKFTDGLDAREEQRLVAVREELDALEAER